MPESIVDKVMAEWVYSGVLLLADEEKVEKAIHQTAAEVRAKASGIIVFEGTRAGGLRVPRSSVAFAPPQGLNPVTIREVVVEDTEWDRPPAKTSPGQHRRGKRENFAAGDVRGPGSLREKAKKLGVSHMTVRRRMMELKKGREDEGDTSLALC